MKRFSFNLILAMIAFFTLAQNASAQWTSNATSIYPDASNINKNVGIGFAAPTQKLHLGGGAANMLLENSTGSATGNIFFGGVTTSSQNGMRLSFSNSTAVSSGLIDVRSATGPANRGLVFRVDITNGGTERLRIRADNGNVGIGTAALGVNAPSARLHVHAAASASNIIANFSDSQNRHIFFVPKTAVGGYTYVSKADDAGLFWSDNNGFNTTSGFVIAPQNGDWTGIRLAADGSAQLPGYRTTVGNGIVNASLGSAGGAGLGWGTSYLGFNAARNKAGTQFTFESDGANNGGNLIWGDVGGKLRFAAVPTTGTTAKTLTEAQVLSQTKMSIAADGKVMIGPDGTTVPNNFRLYVRDGIMTEHLTVAVYGSSSWPDYVFEDNYKLPSLEEVETYIQKEKHLPNVPSAQEMVDKGLDVATTDAMLLRKIEEMTLYLIEMKKENAALKQAIENIQNNQK